MKSKALIHLIVAIVLALMAGFLTINWLKTQQAAKRAPAQTEKKVEVAVAVKALPKGTRLAGNMLKLSPYDPASVPSGAFMSLGELDGRALSRDVSAMDPITQDKLYPKGVQGSGLSMTVEKGRRAITVKGNHVLGAAGLIVPGSRVDVLMTITLKADDNESAKGKEYKVSKLILSDIPVLATGSELEPKVGKDGREELSSVDSYTLEVTPEDAEKLSLAAAYGTLGFALRQDGDNEAVTTTGADLTATLNSYRTVLDESEGEAPPPPLSAKEKGEEDEEPAPYSVETIRGVEKEEVTLELPGLSEESPGAAPGASPDASGRALEKKPRSSPKAAPKASQAPPSALESPENSEAPPAPGESQDAPMDNGAPVK